MTSTTRSAGGDLFEIYTDDLAGIPEQFVDKMRGLFDPALRFVCFVTRDPFAYRGDEQLELRVGGSVYEAHPCGVEPRRAIQPSRQPLTDWHIWAAVKGMPTFNPALSSATDAAEEGEWLYTLECIDQVRRAIRDLRALEIDSLHRLPLDHLEADLDDLAAYIRAGNVPDVEGIRRLIAR